MVSLSFCDSNEKLLPINLPHSHLTKLVPYVELRTPVEEYKWVGDEKNKAVVEAHFHLICQSDRKGPVHEVKPRSEVRATEGDPPMCHSFLNLRPCPPLVVEIFDEPVEVFFHKIEGVQVNGIQRAHEMNSRKSRPAVKYPSQHGLLPVKNCLYPTLSVN